MRAGRAAALVLAVGLAGPGGVAQAQSLADLRVDLAKLQSQLGALASELEGGGESRPLAGETALERLAAVEAELQRITGKSEELDYRIRRIVQDGTSRVAALTERLCTLEPDCDPAGLSLVARLGGDPAPPPPVATPDPTPALPGLSNEERAWADARAAFETGPPDAAIAKLRAFTETYPGGAQAGAARLLLGRAQEQAGDLDAAARTFLTSFSSGPNSAEAPEALYRLGVALGGLGKLAEACATLSEVPHRYESSPFAAEARQALDGLTCPQG